MRVVKPAWGIKRACQSCDAKFYDMQRSPIVCPKCGAVFDAEASLKTRRSRPAEKVVPLKPEAAKKPKIAEEIVDDVTEEIEADETDEDEELIEDASELGEDDEDMAEVIEKAEGNDEV
jgi:uncharacterized protein (TIGR02300 family)